MVDAVLAMAGRTTWTLMNATVALVVNVSVSYYLLTSTDLGILGAAIGWAAGIVVNNVLPLTQLAVSMRLHPFGRGTLLAMLVAGCWLGVLPLVAALTLGSGLPVLVGAVAVGFAGYAATSWRLKDVFELDALVRATKRRRGERAATGAHGGHAGHGGHGGPAG
jgi:hypothetical protein